MSIWLKHRTAAGGRDGLWDYDAGRRVVDVVLRKPHLEIEPVWICSAASPRFGAFPVFRIDASTWRIAIAAFIDTTGHALPRPRQHHADLPLDEIMLCDAPDYVSDELSQLARR